MLSPKPISCIFPIRRLYYFLSLSRLNMRQSPGGRPGISDGIYASRRRGYGPVHPQVSQQFCGKMGTCLPRGKTQMIYCSINWAISIGWMPFLHRWMNGGGLSGKASLPPPSSPIMLPIIGKPSLFRAGKVSSRDAVPLCQRCLSACAFLHVYMRE